MVVRKIKLLFLCFFLSNLGYGQFVMKGFLKTGVNFSYIINKSHQNIIGFKTKYSDIKNPLVRPIYGVGIEGAFGKKKSIKLSSTLYFQSMGTNVQIHNFLNSGYYNKRDIWHFMSYNLCGYYRVLSTFYVGLGIQNSLYMWGSFNREFENWDGFKWSVIGNMRSLLFKSKMTAGMEIDHDIKWYPYTS